MSDEVSDEAEPTDPDAVVLIHDHAAGPDAFGACHSCDELAAVRINGNPMCIKHMNEQFAGISELARRIAGEITRQQGGERA